MKTSTSTCIATATRTVGKRASTSNISKENSLVHILLKSPPMDCDMSQHVTMCYTQGVRTGLTRSDSQVKVQKHALISTTRLTSKIQYKTRDSILSQNKTDEKSLLLQAPDQVLTIQSPVFEAVTILSFLICPSRFHLRTCSKHIHILYSTNSPAIDRLQLPKR